MSAPDLAHGEADTIERAAEVERRIEAVQARLRDEGRDAVLLTKRKNVAWLTVGAALHVVAGGDDSAVPILVHRAGATAIAPNNEADRIADEELAGLPVEINVVAWHDPAALDEEIRGRARVPAQDVAGDAGVEPWLVTLRSVLGPLEQRRLRWLGGRVARSMQLALADVEPGATEDAAVGGLAASLAVDGVRAPVVLAAADERIARYRHPLPGSTRVRERLMLIVVGERWGLHAALTGFRDLVTPSDEIRDRVHATELVLATMVRATTAGTTMGDVFAAAQAAYRDAGHPDEWRLHHQGGSIGYAPREHVAVPGDPTPIRAGMAFAWNPSIRGAKSESTIIVGGTDGWIDVTAVER